MSAIDVDAAVGDREALVEHGVEAGAEVHAGDDHRRGVDERGDRRRAGHGVGQPGVQRELAALADDPDEQADRAGEQQVVVGARCSSAYSLIADDAERARGEEQ